MFIRLEVIIIKCIGILWNTVNHLKNEILNDIQTMCNISAVFECDIDDKYNFFVKDVYKDDGIDDWKIELKLEHMKKTDNRKIIIIFLDIDDSEKYFNPNKNKVVLTNIELVKNSIRKKYATYIDNYFFDNIFHMNDNEDELASILRVIKSWFPEIYEKYFITDLLNRGKIRKREKNENK